MTMTPTAGDAAGALRALITGTVTEPADPEYDEARRIWNGMIDPRPALIVRPSTAVDVATAIRFARERDLPIAVRGGGHNVAGLANVDDGLVIDLGSIHGVEVDPIRAPPRSVVASPGVSSTRPPSRSDSRRRVASSAIPGSVASPSVAAWAGCDAGTG